MKEFEPGAEANRAQPLPEVTAARRRLPFQGIGRKEWANLGLAALAAFYALYAIWWLVAVGPLRYIAGDFAGLWASAEIAQQLGYARLYDVAVQEQFQRTLVAQAPIWFPQFAREAPVVAGAVPYLPVVVAPFLPLLPLGPGAGYAVWTIINMALLAAYLLRLAYALRSFGAGRVSLMVVALSWPVYMTLFFGQINVPLLVVTGEFVLSVAAGRWILAGVCLGILVAKPQLLILVVPGLLLARQYRAVLSLAATAGALLALSAYLIGWQGLVELGGVLASFWGSLATNAPEHMMNWRALGHAIEPLVDQTLQRAIVLGGMLLCGIAVLPLWWRGRGSQRRRQAAVLLATFAATNAVTWHSHTQMAAVSIPVLMFAVAAGVIPGWLASIWLLAPALVFAATLFTLSEPMTYAGLATFGLNLLLEVWAITVFLRDRVAVVNEPSPQTLLLDPTRPFGRAGEQGEREPMNVANTALSVVVPVCNSAVVLPEILACLTLMMEGRAIPHEVVLVNDGSRKQLMCLVGGKM